MPPTIATAGLSFGSPTGRVAAGPYRASAAGERVRDPTQPGVAGRECAGLGVGGDGRGPLADVAAQRRPVGADHGGAVDVLVLAGGEDAQRPPAPASAAVSADGYCGVRLGCCRNVRVANSRSLSETGVRSSPPGAGSGARRRRAARAAKDEATGLPFPRRYACSACSALAACCSARVAIGSVGSIGLSRTIAARWLGGAGPRRPGPAPIRTRARGSGSGSRRAPCADGRDRGPAWSR